MIGGNFKVEKNEFSFRHVKTEVPVRRLVEMQSSRVLTGQY